MPFTVTDNNDGYINGTTIPGQVIGKGQTGGCSGANASDQGIAPPCINIGGFIDTGSASFTGYTNFPQQARNQYRGPRFFDMDMSLTKNFKIRERASFGVGANAFNVFNHPNFNLPDSGIGDSTFGDITSTVSVPASPYGAFAGAAASARILQLTAKITF